MHKPYHKLANGQNADTFKSQFISEKAQKLVFYLCKRNTPVLFQFQCLVSPLFKEAPFPSTAAFLIRSQTDHASRVFLQDPFESEKSLSQKGSTRPTDIGDKFT